MKVLAHSPMAPKDSHEKGTKFEAYPIYFKFSVIMLLSMTEKYAYKNMWRDLMVKQTGSTRGRL